MTSAWVLSGGGARAAAQVGMMRALLEAGERPDLIVGASAGAVNGSWLALNPDNLDDLERVWLSLRTRKVFPGRAPTHAYNLLRHGYVHRIHAWRNILLRHFGEATFEDAVIRLVAVTVRLADGSVATHASGPVLPVLLASTAVPGLFPPQEIDGQVHVDGAVVEYLPVPTAVRLGADTMYAFDCSDFPEGDGRIGAAMDRGGQIAATAWVRLVLQNAAHQGVSVTHLRPPLGPIYDGRDFSQTRRLIDGGYDYVSRVLAERNNRVAANAGRMRTAV